MDPARTDALRGALALVHPLLAGLAILGAVVVLNWGLVVRTARLRRRPSPERLVHLHERVAPYVMWGLGVVFASGALSVVFLRGWQPFRTVHGWAGLAASGCFAAASLLGRQLRADPTRRRSLHGNLGLVGILAAVVAVLFGFELLP